MNMRLLWIVNHKTLIDAELPILNEIGCKVFVPKRIPSESGFRSGATTRAYDISLRLPRNELAMLNETDFYGSPLTPCVRDVVSRRFDVVMCNLSEFGVSPLIEICNFFEGTIIARAFGREHPKSYAGQFKLLGRIDEAREAIVGCGERFVFAPAYGSIADIEPAFLTSKVKVVGVPMSDRWLSLAGTWRGGSSNAILCCPAIGVEGYYRDLYTRVSRAFKNLPLNIFGSQPTVVDDERVLPYLSPEALEQLFQRAAVYLYPSEEPRHVHYSVLEAIAVGTPTLVMEGSLIASMIPEGSPSICADLPEMATKAQHIIDRRDPDLENAVRRANQDVIREFEPSRIKDQWEGLMRGHAGHSGRNVRSLQECSPHGDDEFRIGGHPNVKHFDLTGSYGSVRQEQEQ